MKQIIIVCLLILLVIGCTSYEHCVDSCAKIECDYDSVIRPSVDYKLDIDNCKNQNITTREYCYYQCKCLK